MTGLLAALLEANIAAAVAIGAILLARRHIHSHLGPRAAYLVWLAVPAAMLATLLPARTAIALRPAIDLSVDISSLASAPHAVHAADWTPLAAAVLTLLWVAGAVAMALFLGRRQMLFLGDVARGLAGPAVVGFQKPRIVTPDDFERRFSPSERRLILAHETIHLERHDARINALVALARCACWFNPLIHIGSHVLRIDQELSCDAAVIERRPRARRAYAETLLRTQLASRPLPVGCYWPATTNASGTPHPLTERIAMLTKRPFSRRRRLAASAAVLLLAGAGGLAAWAAQPAITVEVLQAAPSDDSEVVVAFQPIGRNQILSQHATVADQPAPAPQQAKPKGKSDYPDDGTIRPRPGKDFTQPEYPAASIAAHEEGMVTVDACVAPSGLIESATLVKSSGFQRLDEATVVGLVGLKLDPATKNGKPVRYCPYKFSLMWSIPAEQPKSDPPAAHS